MQGRDPKLQTRLVQIPLLRWQDKQHQSLQPWHPHWALVQSLATAAAHAGASAAALHCQDEFSTTTAFMCPEIPVQGQGRHGRPVEPRYASIPCLQDSLGKFMSAYQQDSRVGNFLTVQFRLEKLKKKANAHYNIL